MSDKRKRLIDAAKELKVALSSFPGVLASEEQQEEWQYEVQLPALNKAEKAGI